MKPCMTPRPLPPAPMMPITMRSLAPNTLLLNEGWARTPSPTAVLPRNFLRLISFVSMIDLPHDWLVRILDNRARPVQRSLDSERPADLKSGGLRYQRRIAPPVPLPNS